MSKRKSRTGPSPPSPVKTAHTIKTAGIAIPAVIFISTRATVTLRPHRYPNTPHTNPQKWAVGTTFEWEFDFPMLTNSAYQPQPEPKTKTKKPANPNAAHTRARKASKPETALTAKPKASEKPKRVRLTPEERQERQERRRARAAENRHKLKDSGLCKDRRQPAITGQTRYPACVEKHRQGNWRRSGSAK